MKEKGSKLMSLRRSALVLLLAAVGSFQLYAQKQISGVVKDDIDEVVPGAVVKVKGTASGTLTNDNGQFELTVPNDADSIVVESMTGNKTFKISGAFLNLSLKADEVIMDEFVMVGYQEVRKKDLVATVTSASGDRLKDMSVSNVSEALSGQLAGVSVTTTEGAPDADVKIRVRGGGSITGDNTPLYIVDGFPVSSISDIPPSNIKSIDVLKDASATAIYGSQGANGVVIITTKDPSEEGKFNVEYTGFYGWKNIAKTLDVLNPGDFARWNYELQAIKEMGGSANAVKDKFSKYFNSTDPTLASYSLSDYNNIMSHYDGMKGSNWQDSIFGLTGTTKNHSLSVLGGGKNVSYNLSYSNITDKAIMLGSDYKRNNVEFKLNSKPLSFIKINLSAKYYDTQVNGSGGNDVNGGETTTADSRLRHTIVYTPIPLVDYTAGDGVEEEEVGNLYPPKDLIFDIWKQTRKQQFNYNGSVAVTLSKGLVLKSELGMNKTKYDTERYYGPISYASRTFAGTKYDNTGVPTSYVGLGIVTMNNENSSKLRNANTLSFEKKNFIKKGSNFGFILGEETTSEKNSFLYTEVAGLPSYLTYKDAFAFTSTAGYVSQVVNYYEPDENMLSFFGRVNYDYKSKYYFSATMRADGSSKFADGNRWGYFPSAAIKWRASSEKFLRPTKRWLNDLSVRLSFGEVGNNKIISSQYYQTYNVDDADNYLPSLGNLLFTSGNYMPNPELRWETTITRNLGFDFEMLRSKKTGTLDLYLNNTRDLLLLVPLDGSGYVGQYQNIGSTQNKGVEFSVRGEVYKKKNFTVNVTANVARNVGKVVKLDGRDEMYFASGWTTALSNSTDYLVKVGEPVGLMYGYVNEGRYAADDFAWDGNSWEMNTGKYTDGDGDGIFTDNKGNAFVNNSNLARKSWGPGAIKFKDLNGDGVITTADQKVIGNANPKLSGGFALNVNAYDFDLSANFSYSYGNDVYNANKIEFTSSGLDSWYGRNLTSEMASGNRWTFIDPNTGQVSYDTQRLAELNANTTLWSPEMNGFIFHSWAVEDGSFLRLSSLTLGYTLPEKLTKKAYIQKLRFYATASNIFCWTNYSGFDPEVDTRRKTPTTPGVDYSAYPKSRSYNIGVNLSF